MSDTSVADTDSGEIDFVFARYSCDESHAVVEIFSCASLSERGI